MKITYDDESDNRDVLDFTAAGLNPSPYQCKFCSELLIEHSDPSRLTTGQLWICPSCGDVKDESIETDQLVGTRESGTVMDDISPSNINNSIQFISEEKGLLTPEKSRIDQLIEEEFYNVREFRQKGIVKDSIRIQEITK